MFGKTIADTQSRVQAESNLRIARMEAESYERIAKNWERTANERQETIDNLRTHNAQNYKNYIISEVGAIAAGAVMKDLDGMLNEIKNDSFKMQTYEKAIWGVDREDKIVNRNIHRRRVYVAAARAQAKKIASEATDYYKDVVNPVQHVEDWLAKIGLIDKPGGEVV